MQKATVSIYTEFVRRVQQQEKEGCLISWIRSQGSQECCFSSVVFLSAPREGGVQVLPLNHSCLSGGAVDALPLVHLQLVFVPFAVAAAKLGLSKHRMK